MKKPDDPPCAAAGPAGAASWRRRLRRCLLALVASLVAVVVVADRFVDATARPLMFDLEDAPDAMCILVPGARVYDDGTPCAMLVDRLAAAAQLFAAGNARVVVVSGRGGGSKGEDEVAAMRRWLEAGGVPAADILEDPRGLRTIESVRNCRRALGMRSALVVSNRFHVPRLVFLGRSVGLEAYGVAAPARVSYPRSVRWRNSFRELLAKVRACLDVYL